jgi:DNA-binding NtrC family response regulator
MTVLVVEDESLVRMSIAIELESAGYRVREAADADAALRLIAEETISVLFTDVDMPGSMNGLALASLIRDRFPQLPIIVVSGHLEVAAEQLPSKSEFLTKPYLTDQVVAAIQRLSR